MRKTRLAPGRLRVRPLIFRGVCPGHVVAAHAGVLRALCVGLIAEV